MAEYTKIETARAIICDFCNQLYSDEPCEPADCDWLRMLDEDAADVVPVVHSYWESYDCSQYMGTDEYGEPKWRDGRFYVCHNYRCRRKTVIKSNFCPNCGARMDGGDSDDANGNG